MNKEKFTDLVYKVACYPMLIGTLSFFYLMPREELICVVLLIGLPSIPLAIQTIKRRKLIKELDKLGLTLKL